jgi:hypothetical protein
VSWCDFAVNRVQPQRSRELVVCLCLLIGSVYRRAEIVQREKLI